MNNDKQCERLFKVSLVEQDLSEDMGCIY